MSAISYADFECGFKYRKALGKGNYATVTAVEHLADHSKYALKQLTLSSSDALSQALNEIEVLKAL